MLSGASTPGRDMYFTHHLKPWLKRMTYHYICTFPYKHGLKSILPYHMNRRFEKTVVNYKLMLNQLSLCRKRSFVAKNIDQTPRSFLWNKLIQTKSLMIDDIHITIHLRLRYNDRWTKPPLDFTGCMHNYITSIYPGEIIYPCLNPVKPSDIYMGQQTRT